MRNYIQAQEKLGKLDRRKLENNTYLERRGPGAIAVKLHATDVVTFYADGRTVLDSGGWRTPTTKGRINGYSPRGIYQTRGVWYLDADGVGVGFEDGITINADGSVEGGSERHEREDAKLLRRCRAYARSFVRAMAQGKVPPPGPGDCWYCLMRVQPEGSDGTRTGTLHPDGKLHNEATCKPAVTGRTLGEQNGDRTHILSHIEESYFVPSLLWRAGEVFPVSQVAKWWVGGIWQKGELAPSEVASLGGVASRQWESAIYRFVKRQLGFAA